MLIRWMLRLFTDAAAEQKPLLLYWGRSADEAVIDEMAPEGGSSKTSSPDLIGFKVSELRYRAPSALQLNF